MSVRATALIAAMALAGVVGSAQAQTANDYTYTQNDGTHVTVRTGQENPPPAGPAPSFEILDTNHEGFIDQNEAIGYPLLADDFIRADRNRDGKISRAEYERWVKQP